MNTAINGAAELDGVEIGAETCAKSEDCDKPNGHTGRCKGTGGSASGRNEKKAKAVKVVKAKASKPKPARNGHKPVSALTATALAAVDPGHFKIEYEDGMETINLEGIGRDVFAAKLKMLYTSLTGGSNA